MSESLRQQVFDFLDLNPLSQNEVIYKRFPNDNKSSLRQYKAHWFVKLEKMGIILPNLSDPNSLSEISLNVLMENTSLKNGFAKTRQNATTGQNLLYPKIAEKNQIKKKEQNHIIPLIRTFKLLPLYIFKKTHNIIKIIEIKDYSVVDIVSGIIDLMNLGNYKIDEIANFTLHNDGELKGFLSDPSWKRSCIKNINSWIGLERETNFNYETGIPIISYKYSKMKIKQIEFYKQLKGKIIINLLPEFYGIYLHTRNKNYIIGDFAKACFINNLSNDKPVSLSQLVDRYNGDLEFRKHPKKYHIDLGYSETSEFLDNN